jgi:hypothetical protein
MWLLSFIPDSWLAMIVHGMVILGILLYVLGVFGNFIPFMRYGKFLKPVGVIVMIIGVWFSGGYDVESEWREKVRIAEEKVAKAQAEAKNANVKLAIEQKKKVKVIHDTKIIIKQKIVEKEKIIDAECKVAPEALDILNEAAKTPGAIK